MTSCKEHQPQRNIAPRAFTLLGVLVLAGVSILSMTAGSARERDLTFADRLLPAYEIIRFGELPNGVGRLDTSTGAIWRFHGDLRKSNVRSQWVKAGGVAGVTNRPAGSLQIQEAAGAIFLVDVLTGESWILKDRGTGLAWDEVTVLR